MRPRGTLVLRFYAFVSWDLQKVTMQLRISASHRFKFVTLFAFHAVDVVNVLQILVSPSIPMNARNAGLVDLSDHCGIPWLAVASATI